MSVSGVTSSSVAAAYTPPPQQTQQAKAPQQAPKTDTVTISKQAQQLSQDGDPAALEAQESSAEKAGEASKGKA
jgi:hypothetical protein